MPRVPQLSGPQVSIQRGPVAFQTQRADVGAFTVQGRALQQGANRLEAAGDLLAQNALRMKKEDDANKAFDAYVRASEKARTLLHDPERGIYARKGKNAEGAYDEARVELEKYEAEILDTLENDDQKQAFRVLWRRKRETDLDGVARHVAREREVYRQETVKAVVAGAIEDAQNNFANPKAISEALAAGETAIRVNLNGQSPDVIKQQIEAFRSQLHTGVIERMAIHNPTAAKAYYEAHKAEVDGANHAQIEKLLKDGVTRQEAQRHEDEIIAKYGAGNLSAALEAARKIKDPALRDDVVRRIHARHAEFRTIREEAERQNRDAAWGYALKPDTTSIDQIPINIWSGLDGTTQRVISDFIENRNRRARRENSDMAVYDKLNRMVTDDLERFKNYDILQHANDLSERHLEKFLDLQRTARAGDGGGKVTATRTVWRMVNDALARIGIDPTPKEGTKAAERVAAFKDRVDEEVLALERDLKRKAKPDEIRAIIDRLTTPVEIRGAGFFGLVDLDKFFFEVTDEELERIVIDDVSQVPRADVEKIKDFIGRNPAGAEKLLGRKISGADDRAIIDLYLLKLRTSRKRAEQ